MVDGMRETDGLTHHPGWAYHTWPEFREVVGFWAAEADVSLHRMVGHWLAICGATMMPATLSELEARVALMTEPGLVAEKYFGRGSK